LSLWSAVSVIISALIDLVCLVPRRLLSIFYFLGGIVDFILAMILFDGLTVSDTGYVIIAFIIVILAVACLVAGSLLGVVSHSGHL